VVGHCTAGTAWRVSLSHEVSEWADRHAAEPSFLLKLQPHSCGRCFIEEQVVEPRSQCFSQLAGYLASYLAN
jgi:hypothetical protein